MAEENLELFDKMLQHRNIYEAAEKVRKNGGAPGVDGMTVDELAISFRVLNKNTAVSTESGGLIGQTKERAKALNHEVWSHVEQQLRNGTYTPQPVRKVEIPKPGGGIRTLGIPTVIDRVIQQALLQVLTPIFDPTFSEVSYGFRPGRGAHQAIEQARQYVVEGRTWVVDLDLEKFFDLVNHDVLMSKIARKIKDKKVLRLIGKFLRSGMMDNGVEEARVQGTPQGGPLSPLLSNIMLDVLDKELEVRGHKFVRYADDCNIYVKTKEAGERVMDSIENFLNNKLRLKVNKKKSAVARPWERKFLGFTVTKRKPIKIKVAEPSKKKLKEKLLEKLKKARGQSIQKTIMSLRPTLMGWRAYFRKSEVIGVLGELDEWLQRKIRGVMWRQWKHAKTRVNQLISRGIEEREAKITAYSSYGPWRLTRFGALIKAMPTREMLDMGLVMLVGEQRKLKFST